MPKRRIIKKEVIFDVSKIIENNNVVVCLSVFNNEFGLPFCLNNLLKIRYIFDKFNIIAFYDKSKDSSLKILRDFKQKNIINIDIIVNKNKKSNMRTKNIARARNKLLETIREKYNNYYYFIMMDTNEYACIGEINRNLLHEVIHSNKYDYDSASFNREAGYNDLWALSFDPYIYSIFHFDNWQSFFNEKTKYFRKLLDAKEIIEVYSAYNGFAIYKTNKFLNCSYSSNIDKSLFPHGSIEKQIEISGHNIIGKLINDCEHRKFHLEAIKKNNAKIIIITDNIFFKFKDPPHGLRGMA